MFWLSPQQFVHCLLTFIYRMQIICTCSLYSLETTKNSYGVLFIKALFFTTFKNVCAICPNGIFDGARCLFASSSSICFVVLLASGAAEDGGAADNDAGAAAGFDVFLPVIIDLDLSWGAGESEISHPCFVGLLSCSVLCWVCTWLSAVP